jgi:hypothetical protein
VGINSYVIGRSLLLVEKAFLRTQNVAPNYIPLNTSTPLHNLSDTSYPLPTTNQQQPPKMMSQAAMQAEKAVGHGDNATTIQDVTNPANNPAWADKSGEKMMALAWMGKNSVEMVEVPKPALIEDRDVILKITGSTVCGSDLHLLHGSVVELQKGDILGHEFCGVIDSVGKGITKFKPGYVHLMSLAVPVTNSRPDSVL